MNSEDLLDKRIERYIFSRMTEDEITEFENELKSDPRLKNEIEFLITIKPLFNNALFELKRKLNDTEKELGDEDFFKND